MEQYLKFAEEYIKNKITINLKIIILRQKDNPIDK